MRGIISDMCCAQMTMYMCFPRVKLVDGGAEHMSVRAKVCNDEMIGVVMSVRYPCEIRCHIPFCRGQMLVMLPACIARCCECRDKSSCSVLSCFCGEKNLNVSVPKRLRCDDVCASSGLTAQLVYGSDTVHEKS